MLLAQISTRLATMSANYREAMAMNVWITLLTRMVELGSQDVKAKAIELLDLARSITLSWIHQLRKELASQTDSKMSHSCCQYTFWAALLCKRACVASIDGMTWTPHALQPYIEASIALQDALDTDPDGLPALAKRALVQDLKMAVRVQPIFRQMLVYYPRCFASALSDIWPSADAQREYGNFLLSDEGHGCWLSSTIKATPLTNAQLVHYSLLTGHLLVDNLPLGRLPAQHRENPVLQRLFGSQNLLVYPSNLPGMLYLLAHPIQNHQLHIGFRNDELYVRALYKSSVLEFIPSKIFYSAAGFDLPLQLIENCAHWLDVSKGVLDIRQQPELWRQKDSNWQLDLLTRLAWRRKSTLVCPGSPVFQRVAQVFSCFEDAQRLTLFQPQQGTLQVELRRFDLSFFVNHKSLLQCRELRSEIAPVQDCGTWYGLRSKLVLRNVYDEQQRSVIVPLGLPMSYFRVGQHVGVRTAMSGEYGIYTINGLNPSDRPCFSQSFNANNDANRCSWPA